MMMCFTCQEVVVTREPHQHACSCCLIVDFCGHWPRHGMFETTGNVQLVWDRLCVRHKLPAVEVNAATLLPKGSKLLQVVPSLLPSTSGGAWVSGQQLAQD